jgi:predicted dehydrogenase
MPRLCARAKRLIESGKLGKIASLWILYNIFHSERAATVYGGVLRAVCTHHAYSVLYLLGRPRKVTAVASRVRDQIAGCEEQAMVVCELEDGAIANLWSSFAVDDPTNDPWSVVYKILGINGGVSYSWNEAQFTDNGGPARGMPNDPSPKGTLLKALPMNCRRPSLQAFFADRGRQGESRKALYPHP